MHSEPKRVRLFETSSLSDLEAAAAKLAADHGHAQRALVIAGGDGSYMAGITALHAAFAKNGGAEGALPPIALIPGGTVNTVARNWGYRGGGLLSIGAIGAIGDRDAAKYTSLLLSAILTGKAIATARPTLRVRSYHGTSVVERIGFIVGAGLVTRFFEVYMQQGARGYRSAASIVMRVFGGSLAGGALARRVLEPARCQLEVDGVRAPFDRTSLVCASVVRDLGLGLRLLYRAGESRERFHIVATPLDPSRLGPQLPLVLAGKPLFGTRVDVLARKATLTMPNEGAFVLDGELEAGERVEIEAGPTIQVFSV